MNKNNILSAVVILLSLLLAGCNRQDFSQPWFKGTETNLVCKRPYTHNSDCYSLQTTSDGEVITRIIFTNGGHLTAVDSVCYEGASDYNFDQFCSVWDKEDNIWDVIPAYGDVEPERN